MNYVALFFSSMDDSAEVHEWLVKDDSYKKYIPDSFPIASYVLTDEGNISSDYDKANVVYDYLTLS